jgi:TonB family protein
MPWLLERTGLSHAARLVPAVMMASWQHPAYREALLRAWLQVAPPTAWRAALDTLVLPPADDDPVVGVLRDALVSADPDVRRETVWTVVRWAAANRTAPAVLLDAAAQGVADGAGEVTWESFGRELVGRGRRGAKEVDRAAFLADVGSRFPADLFAVAGFNRLTRGENSAAARHLPAPTQGRALPSGPGPQVDWQARMSPMRTIDPVWPGLLDSLFAATGCEGSDEWRLGARRLTWDAMGRPTSASIDRMDLSPACATALGALATVSQADPERVVSAGSDQWLLLPVSREFRPCVDSHLGLRPEVLPSANLGRELRKLRNVSPRIPGLMRQNRMQARVVVDVTISAEGCVAAAELAVGAATAFNVESMRAVLAWRYEPPRLETRPVAVTVAVTVAYTLN